MAEASCKLSPARKEYVSSKTPAWSRSLFTGKDFAPASAQDGKPVACSLPASIVQLTGTMQSRDRAVYLNRRRPPNYRCKLCCQLLKLITCPLLNAEWDQSAGIPESGAAAHRPSSLSSLSSRTACVAAFPLTVALGIFHSWSRSNGFSGRRMAPAATRANSSSLASSAAKGINLATGRFRSRMMTTSRFSHRSGRC